MLSVQGSPLAPIGGADAGGQNVYVGALAGVLAKAGHKVTVYTRRDAPNQPDEVSASARFTVRHVPAGPPKAVPGGDQLPHMGAFGGYLADSWSAQPPDVVHAHEWMMGLAARVGTRDLGLPVVQTFPALCVVERRHEASEDPCLPARVRLETAIAKNADGVVATPTEECS